MNEKLAIGLMSGTSMDGVDAALIKTDGVYAIKSLAHYKISYTPEFKYLLKATEYTVFQCQGDLELVEKIFAKSVESYFQKFLRFNEQQLQNVFLEIQTELHLDPSISLEYRDVVEYSSLCHLKAVIGLLSKAKLSASDIDIIGYHGQTFYHAPERGISCQAGNAKLLANSLGISVISNFRQNDIVHGGQGAPFAPIYHQALAIRDGLVPLGIVNCGGISNVTLVYGTDETDVIGYDCGPGNVLIDQWVRINKPNYSIDINGEFGAQGNIRQDILEKLFNNSCRKQGYYELVPPKSLDGSDLQLLDSLQEYSFEDVCASLESFTASIIVKSLQLINKPLPLNWLLCGGGWKNPIIFREFERALSETMKPNIQLSDTAGWDSDCLEAEMFAYLAVRSQLGLVLSYPNTTGVSKAVSGGELCTPSASSLNQ